jgi:hypothetical protein
MSPSFSDHDRFIRAAPPATTAAPAKGGAPAAGGAPAGGAPAGGDEAAGGDVVADSGVGPLTVGWAAVFPVLTVANILMK